MKTVLITGASKGIGKATATLLAQKGYRVAIHYCRDEEGATQLCDHLLKSGHTAMTCRADVRLRSDVNEMIAQIGRTFGPVDILINNAGIAQQKLFDEITDEDWSAMFDIHVRGMYYCAQAVLADMIAKKDGCIINISSVWGMVGASCEVHYSAAKAAVIGFTKALAKEMGPSNIRVNCVAPGIIDTAMNAAFSQETLQALTEETPLGRLGTPSDIAEAIYFLSSDKARFITGQVLSPNGGFII